MSRLKNLSNRPFPAWVRKVERVWPWLGLKIYSLFRVWYNRE